MNVTRAIEPSTSASANCHPRKIHASAATWGERFVEPKTNAIIGISAAPLPSNARPESAAKEQVGRGAENHAQRYLLQAGAAKVSGNDFTRDKHLNQRGKRVAERERPECLPEEAGTYVQGSSELVDQSCKSSAARSPRASSCGAPFPQ
jgi:hypothetical protein